MGILTIILFIIIALTVVRVLKGKTKADGTPFQFGIIKSLGLLALVVGMLGQFIGLFSAFELIGEGMQVSPEIMASGVKVSMIASIYGMIIFVVSYILWFLVKLLKK